jgi:hypothetical protein
MVFEASTLEGFIQQLAVSYVARGHWFYVMGSVPMAKDPRAVDEKLVARYGAGLSRFERCRRKRAGLASVRYIRYGLTFVLAATSGEHRFFEEEANIHDVRKTPIKVGGYSVSHLAGRVSVRIERHAWKLLRAYYLEEANRRPVEWFIREFWRWPFEPWAPVRRQTFIIVNQVNKARKSAGLPLVPTSCVRLKRHIVRPFELQEPMNL